MSIHGHIVSSVFKGAVTCTFIDLYLDDFRAGLSSFHICFILTFYSVSTSILLFASSLWLALLQKGS